MATSTAAAAAGEAGSDASRKRTVGEMEAAAPQNRGGVDQFDMQVYYARFFPFHRMHTWLSYGSASSPTFVNREWSFTLPGDIYIRFQSFNTEKAWQDEVRRMTPIKMDIGAVYTLPPKDHKSFGVGAFTPVEKEFVIDIDLTDYDDIRTCCQGADICGRCWPFMTVAIKIMDRALRVDFGFEHLLFVYSGRRGVHCWVADERARTMSEEARRSVIDYLSIVSGGEDKAQKVRPTPALYHPSIGEALAIIDTHFVDLVVEGQGQLATAVDTYLDDLDVRITGDNTRDWTRLNKKLGSAGTSAAQSRAFLAAKLHFSYPRLDEAVSTGINHLLKSPFCVHPKTGRVCVPMDVDNIDDFDFAAVPTVRQLIEELNAYDAEHGNGEDGDGEDRLADWKKTSLKPYFEVFDVFLANLTAEIRRSRRDAASTTDDDSVQVIDF